MLKEAVLYPFSGFGKDLHNIGGALRWIISLRVRILFAFCRFVWQARKLNQPEQSIHLVKMACRMRHLGSPPFGICYRCTEQTGKLLTGLHRGSLAEAVKSPVFDFNRRRREIFINALRLARDEGVKENHT